MKRPKPIQYSVRDVPAEVDQALRRRAHIRGKSLNGLIVEILSESLGTAARPRRYRDLSDLAGKWVPDPEFDARVREQRQVDEAMWR